MTISAAPSAVLAPLVPTFRDVWPQIVSTVIILSAVTQIGVGLAYSGVLIPQLANDSNIKGFDKTDASWTAGIFAVAEIGGALSGKVMDKIGRKNCFLISQFPLVASWWILVFSYYSMWPIYLSRALSGFGSGVMCTVVYVYISEISHARFRGTLSVMTSVSASLGMLMATMLGVLVNWHSMSLIIGIMSLASITLSFFLPESPHWLMKLTNRPPEEAMKQMRYLNRPEWLYQEAWDQLQAELKSKDAPESTKSLVFQLKQRTSYMPLILLTILFILQQFSGTYLVISYSVNLFASVGKNLQGFVTVDGAVMAMGALRLLITILSVMTSKYLSKNQIMIVSGVLTSLSAATVSICMQWNNVSTVEFHSTGYDSSVTDATSGASTVGTIVLLLFFACGAFGIMVVPWTLPSDLLSTSMRAFGNVYSFVLSNLLFFGIVKMFPLSLDYVSLPVVFGIFALFAAAFTAFVWFFLPDTSGKHFDDIATFFEKKSEKT